jgi:quercetin dioxygenase-like cupin family protein
LEQVERSRLHLKTQEVHMKTARAMAAAVLIVGSGLGLHLAQQPAAERAALLPHEAATAAFVTEAISAPLRETVTVAADQPIPNLPGKRLVSLIVDYPPGASSASHHHAASAFIYAYVLSGEIRSQVDSEPARVYRPGESWFESPGAHHRVSENASDTEPARLLAVIVVDAADEQLTIPDRR